MESAPGVPWHLARAPRTFTGAFLAMMRHPQGAPFSNWHKDTLRLAVVLPLLAHSPSSVPWNTDPAGFPQRA